MPSPRQNSVIRRKEESAPSRWSRLVSQALADLMYTPGSAPAQQTEEGFQTLFGALSPVDLETGMPNVDKGVVAPVIKTARRSAFAKYLDDLMGRVGDVGPDRFVIEKPPGRLVRNAEEQSYRPDEYMRIHPGQKSTGPKVTSVDLTKPQIHETITDRDTEFHSTRLQYLDDIIAQGYLGFGTKNKPKNLSTKRAFTKSSSVPSEAILELDRLAPEVSMNVRRPYVEKGWEKIIKRPLLGYPLTIDDMALLVDMNIDSSDPLLRTLANDLSKHFANPNTDNDELLDLAKITIDNFNIKRSQQNPLSSKFEFENRTLRRIPINPNTVKAVYLNKKDLDVLGQPRYEGGPVGINTYRFVKNNQIPTFLFQHTVPSTLPRNSRVILPARIGRQMGQLPKGKLDEIPYKELYDRIRYGTGRPLDPPADKFLDEVFGNK